VRGGNYNELTFGTNWKISPRLTLRKEIRYDWSNVRAPALNLNGMYDDFSDKNQLTMATDLIFRF
jgi:hypothetical protein